ncbi:MAG: glycosyltransferase family 2 protein [Phycisphaerae bacterium]|nr:glycosyltransferase family 2 protein [Gemmatimonadaceae bacterium]
MPRVSVVMPVYNGERFLAQAMNSVLASTFRDFELLVLDDGSTDGSFRVAQQIAAGDPRVRCIPLQHQGIAGVRNTALRESRGEYIANLDSDDIAFPERLARQVRYLDTHREVVALGSRVLVIDSDGKPKSIVIRTFTHDEIDRWHLNGLGGGIGNPAAMFRKSAAVAVGGYTESEHSIGEDYDLWLRLGEYGRLANLHDVLIRYRVHTTNLSTQPSERGYRETVTLGILARAFARRGITDRVPVRVEPPERSRSEKLCDDALLRYFRGERSGALLRALTASVHNPAAPSTWNTLKTVLGGAPPA